MADDDDSQDSTQYAYDTEVSIFRTDGPLGVQKGPEWTGPEIDPHTGLPGYRSPWLRINLRKTRSYPVFVTYRFKIEKITMSDRSIDDVCS